MTVYSKTDHGFQGAEAGETASGLNADQPPDYLVSVKDSERMNRVRNDSFCLDVSMATLMVCSKNGVASDVIDREVPSVWDSSCRSASACL